jgi:aspartyl-tRNA(Asn)/glutamyl-tRNA(Gln) amidotransferase subunit A
VSDAARLLDGSLAEIAGAIEAGTVSPVALAEAALERAARTGAALNCFVTVTSEVALAEARKAEAELRQGHRRGPLHGIPYGLKDNIDTAGIRTTWGARPYADRVPDRDADVVHRLRAAGAVLVGKLSLLELAAGLGATWAHASINGACRNPWDPARWSGGSSSGSAAAVGARILPFSLGTETLGSLLNPAAFCGVSAFRPTYGTVSREGVLPFAFSFDKVGAMCRTARDCATVLSAIADPGQAHVAAAAARPPPGRDRPRPGARRRAAVLHLPSDGAVPPEVEPRYSDALGVLLAAGFELEPATLPQLPWHEVASVLLAGESEVAFEDLIRSGRTRELSDPSHAHRGGRYALEGRPSDYVKAMAIRGQMQREMTAFFRKYDLIVSANSPWIPPHIDETFLFAFGEDEMSFVGNLLGLPAASVPMGFVPPGKLPVALEIAGPPYRDAEVLEAAALFQSRTRWHLERPPACG